MKEIHTAWSGKASGMSFTGFLFKEKGNRRRLLIVLGAVILQFILFKILYPFPDFFSDSYSYIYAASQHLDVNIWPIGYSKFLGAFHRLTSSDIALVAFQYFFLEAAALYFFYTLIYFHALTRTSRTILFGFLFFNPLFLYLCNYVNSDPLFAALSLWWFTELLWIINRPRTYQVFTQGILLFLCFTVRNNAYYYPLVALAAFLLSRRRSLWKLSGCLAGPLLILPFILHTRTLTRQLTGKPQYSLFTGWQLANNALYIRDRVTVDSTIWATAASRELDRRAQQFFHGIPPGPGYRDYLESYTGNFFIRQQDAPLKQYARRFYATGDKYAGIAAWGRASAVFADYGEQLIRSRPLAFARYFILPNAFNYFFPPLEKLEEYNLGQNEITPSAVAWFELPGPEVHAVSRTLQGNILYPFRFLFLWANLALVFGLCGLILSKQVRSSDPGLNRLALLSGIFWVLNAGFSLCATINVLRYQVVPMVIVLSTAIVVTERFLQGARASAQAKPPTPSSYSTLNPGI